jgi:hypothetical protein
MSGRSFSDYSDTFRSSRKRYSSDASEREKATKDYRESIKTARETVNEKKTREKRETDGLYDKKLVRLGFTRPAEGVKRVHILLVDNSGSNRVIAAFLRESTGYLAAVMNIIDPQSQIAIDFFSDHCDGERIEQIVDFVTPDKKGDKILYSTCRHIYPAYGGDEAEAIECVLWNVCDVDFGEVEEKHLYLVTDVVGHGMGMHSDDGCPFQRDWRRSLERVKETFASFEVVGCGDSPKIGELQKKFLEPDRMAYDFIDLSAIREHTHRLGIVGNAFLFLVARHRGQQNSEIFLSTLYEKWVTDPVFGANTDISAREGICRFVKYLEISDEEKEKMLGRIIVD